MSTLKENKKLNTIWEQHTVEDILTQFLSYTSAVCTGMLAELPSERKLTARQYPIYLSESTEYTLRAVRTMSSLLNVTYFIK